MAPMNPRLLRPIAARGGAGFDVDAAAYVAAVETADTQPLELAVATAINDFIVGCKADGIWDAIKASCILMGARTLSGALTPLVGPSPTNNGPFVSGDYDRKTGLVGDGVGKHLNSNVTHSSCPQDNGHLSIYHTVNSSSSPARVQLGSRRGATGGSNLAVRHTQGILQASLHSSATTGVEIDDVNQSLTAPFLAGASRSNNSNFTGRAMGISVSENRASQAPDAEPFFVLANNDGSAASLLAASRLSFYSIGEFLDLALLDTRVTALYNAIGAAI
jgi:hypothetical protein